MRTFKIKWHTAKGETSLETGTRTLIMGIINTTPDSFSDGGKYLKCDDAVQHGLRLVSEGADILDIGGESSRPFAEPVSLQEELDRVIPVIEKLADMVDIPISIDTVKSRVAKEAVNAGASIINDITALERDELMAPFAAAAGVPVILMHMKGSPATMQINPYYDNFLQELTQYLEERAEFAISSGIASDLIIIDPGIGFGKTVEHNLLTIRCLDKIADIGFPVLVGPSRKSFIQKTLAGKIVRNIEPLSIRTEAGTIGAVAASIINGAHIVRVHDVASARAVADIVGAIQNVVK